jgi:hypothetical protein
VLDASTCPYCTHYLADVDQTCKKCPLATVRGGVNCDRRRENEEEGPWWKASDGRSVEPLIHWLEKAVAYEQRQAKKRKRAKKR